MSEQALDLRKSLQIVRRHRVLVGILAVLGIAGGVTYATLEPPMLTSKALVELPAPTHDVATQVVIANSEPVLKLALPRIEPPVSLQNLLSDTKVRSLTPNIISISAQGHTAAQAQSAASAVAQSYVQFITSGNRSVSASVPATSNSSAKIPKQLGSASTAVGPSRVLYLAITGVLGGLLGVLVGIISALAISRGDRRLRERDEIADSIGSQVLAAVPVGHPTDAAGWTRLLTNYEPGPVHAWQMRRALIHLGMGDLTPLEVTEDGGACLMVLSLSSDPGALALGPQLAVYAASMGTRTALVIGQQQDPSATATLRAACAVASASVPGKSGNLEFAVMEHGSLSRRPDVPLTVVVIAVDGDNPQIVETMTATATVLGVSAGSATAEDLASVAVSAAASGRQVSGILVADPERADRTTGRLTPPARHGSRKSPMRLAGMPTTEATR